MTNQMGIITQMNPRLSMKPGPYKQIKKSLIRYYITEVCSVIARHWHQAEALSLAEWACELNQIDCEERMIAWDDNITKSYNPYVDGVVPF